MSFPLPGEGNASATGVALMIWRGDVYDPHPHARYYGVFRFSGMPSAARCCPLSTSAIDCLSPGITGNGGKMVHQGCSGPLDLGIG